MKKITLGLSPCPNDTFIFDALINRRIDTNGYLFVPEFEDVEQLNRMAFKGDLDITKISVGAYASVSNSYIILDSGSALGSGVGPLMVSKNKNIDISQPNFKIAIPGKFTTANLLLSIFFPEIKNKVEVIFSEIENQVLSGSVDAGLLIHEGRFTYETKGLVKLFDLGEVWESRVRLPLPLGCICAKRTIEEPEQQIISDLIRQSILYAYQQPEEGRSFIKKYAQEMDDAVIEKHIMLYVNKFSLALGDEGRSAIDFLLRKGMETKLYPSVNHPIFNSFLK